MRKHRVKGGEVQPFPLKYYNTAAATPSAAAGHDLLHASGMGIRPRIGGKHKSKRHTKRKRGGFVPSVMGNFIQVASKYITPLALFAGYKFMTRKQKKARHTRRR